MSLQEALRQMRLELGITQMDLADMVHKSFLTVNRWENGKGFPSRDNARSILEIAQKGEVSEECYDYLYDILKPDMKRGRSARPYGFPDIDKDFLFQLADSSTNALYVIEADTYKILYANRQAEKSAARYARERNQTVGERRLPDQSDKRCYHYFGGIRCTVPVLSDEGDG
ncbi:MAG: helix-turn-helix transcriptional regulator [bacterium]|nr:helix-turn-helix transcriptional regulator [bacterium]